MKDTIYTMNPGSEESYRKTYKEKFQKFFRLNFSG
jgi:hypothetical protein